MAYAQYDYGRAHLDARNNPPPPKEQPASHDPMSAPRHSLAESDYRRGDNKPGGRNTPDREIIQDIKPLEPRT